MNPTPTTPHALQPPEEIPTTAGVTQGLLPAAASSAARRGAADPRVPAMACGAGL